MNYSVGYFNGVSDGGSSDSNTPTPDVENDTKGDWAARVFFQPFVNSDNFALRGLGFGVAGTYVDSTGNTTTTLLAELSHAGSADVLQLSRDDRGRRHDAAVNGTFADGERLRCTPQAYYYVGSFGVLGEYVNVSQDVTRATPTAGVRSATLDNTAWQVQLAWFADRRGRAVPRLHARLDVLARSNRHVGRAGSWSRAITSSTSTTTRSSAAPIPSPTPTAPPARRAPGASASTGISTRTTSGR